MLSNTTPLLLLPYLVLPLPYQVPAVVQVGAVGVHLVHLWMLLAYAIKHHSVPSSSTHYYYHYLIIITFLGACCSPSGCAPRAPVDDDDGACVAIHTSHVSVVCRLGDGRWVVQRHVPLFLLFLLLFIVVAGRQRWRMAGVAISSPLMFLLFAVWAMAGR
jgi:hypothetical protein